MTSYHQYILRDRPVRILASKRKDQHVVRIEIVLICAEL
jgi:hypothetical protein